MNRLKLHLDELAVESFDTTCRAEEQGTVFGEQCTCQTVCTCPGCPTCDYTCDDASCVDPTCYGQGQTCDGTCRQQGCGISQYETCPLFCPRDPF